MRCLYKHERGSVSIFLIIIVAIIFFLNAILIDYARILTAKYQTEKAVKTAVRSVLAAYDTDLYINTGIFGLNNGREFDICAEVLEKNLEVSPGFFNYTDIKVDFDSLCLNSKYELANQRVFEQQILEEMKYKAPIDFSLDIINQFTSLSLVMKEATNTTTILRNIENEYNDRNEYLLEAIGEQKNAVSLYNGKNCSNIATIITLYSTYYNNLAELALLDSIKTDVDDEEVEDDTLERIAEIQQTIEQCRNTAINISTEINDYYSSKSSEHGNYLKKTKENLENADSINEELTKTINNAISEVDKPQYDKLKEEATNLTGDIIEENEIINNIKILNNNISNNTDLALDDEYFSNFSTDIEKQSELYYQIVDKLEVLENQVNIAFSSNGSYPLTYLQTTINEIEVIIHSYETMFADYSSGENKVIERETFLIEMQTEINNQTKSLKDDAESSLTSANDLIDIISSVSEQNEEFLNLENIFNQYLEFNDVQSIETKSYSFISSSEDTVDDAVFEIDGLFTELANILENFRNELYIGEYSFARFNLFDFTILKEKNISSESSENLKELLNVSNQEIEYIIYGIDNAGGNIAAALRDIFIIRLAINLVEAFSQPAVLAATNPLIILLEATVYALSTTVLDMNLIMQGEDVCLAKKIKNITFNYGDYLRILYLIRGNEKEKIIRLQALIDYKYNKNLYNINTCVQGSVNTSIELWFIPGVMKAINYIGILDGQVEGNRYIISKTAVMSY